MYDYEPGDNRTIRRADVTVTRALDLIDTWNDRPVFLVVHLFDPHMSYDAPLPFRGVFTRVYDSQFKLPVEDLQTLQMEPLPLRRRTGSSSGPPTTKRYALSTSNSGASGQGWRPATC